MGIERDVVLVLHDWGSALGFDWANQHRDRWPESPTWSPSVTPLDLGTWPYQTEVTVAGKHFVQEDSPDEIGARMTSEHQQLYAKHIAGFRRSIPRSQRMAGPADSVAEAIERALTDTRPRARYVVGRAARAQLLLARATPTRMLDVVLGLGAGVPRRP